MRMSMLALKIILICTDVTVWELVVEKKFSTGCVLSTRWFACGKKVFHKFFHRSVENSMILCHLWDCPLPIDLSGSDVLCCVRGWETTYHLHFSPWASTLTTVTPTARNTFRNLPMSTARIWCTLWPVFFPHQRTSTVWSVLWKTQWTVSELSTRGLRNPWSPAILNSFTTQHHGNSLSHRNWNAWPHCG